MQWNIALRPWNEYTNKIPHSPKQTTGPVTTEVRMCGLGMIPSGEDHKANTRKHFREFTVLK